MRRVAAAERLHAVHIHFLLRHQHDYASSPRKATTDRILEIVVRSLFQFADQARQNLLEVPHDHHVLRVFPLAQLLFAEAIARHRRRREQTAQLRCETTRNSHFGGKPEQNGDDVVSGGEATRLRLGSDVAVPHRRHRHERVVPMWKRGNVETGSRGCCTRRRRALCWCKGLEWRDKSRKTAEGEDEEHHFGDGDNDFAVATRFDGFFPELHVSQQQEEEEGAHWVKEPCWLERGYAPR